MTCRAARPAAKQKPAGLTTSFDMTTSAAAMLHAHRVLSRLASTDTRCTTQLHDGNASELLTPEAFLDACAVFTRTSCWQSTVLGLHQLVDLLRQCLAERCPEVANLASSRMQLHQLTLP